MDQSKFEGQSALTDRCLAREHLPNTVLSGLRLLAAIMVLKALLTLTGCDNLF